MRAYCLMLDLHHLKFIFIYSSTEYTGQVFCEFMIYETISVIV
jgi:hypothetical protein